MLHLSAENGILSKINTFRLNILNSGADLSFPPVDTNIRRLKMRVGNGPRLSSFKIRSQMRSPPPTKIKELWKIERCLPFYGKRVTWISDDYFESFLVPQLLRELKSLNLICHFYMHCQPSLCRLRTRLKRPLLPKHFFISQFEGSFQLKTKDREFRMKVRFAYNSWAKNIVKLLRRFL